MRLEDDMNKVTDKRGLIYEKIREAQTSLAAVVAENIKTLLIVDDEETVRDIIDQALSDYGLSITSVDTGEKALRLFSSTPGSFDLVLLDLAMPGLSGLEVMREMRGIRPEQSIVVVTGGSLPDEISDLKEEGILSVLRKPFGIQELLWSVRRALN